MYKILITLLVIVCLSGCGIYNLGNFTVPNDVQFIECIAELDTPYKIALYVEDNFTYERHYFYAPDPYTLWKTEKGDCNDFSTFGTFVANYHGYETYQIEINHGTRYTHYLGVYAEDMYSFTDNRSYHYGFNTFKDIVGESTKYTGQEWVSYKVYDYKNQLIEKGTNG